MLLSVYHRGHELLNGINGSDQSAYFLKRIHEQNQFVAQRTFRKTLLRKQQSCSRY